MNRKPPTSAEPGTGTQTCTVATPPAHIDGGDDEYPNVWRNRGEKWKAGHEYFDVQLRDIVVLAEVIRVSSWCDTRPPEEAPVKLVFEYERRGSGPLNRTTVDPNRPDSDLSDRFIERYTPDPPLGVETPW